MASSRIDDPFVLASYTSSPRGKPTLKKATGVYATSYKKSSSSDGFVTVAAQADGLHIIDVSTLHPIISHILGPSTSFTCPPLTLPSSSTHTSATYAVISASTQLESPEDADRALWMWEDDTSKTAKPKVKRSKTLFAKNQAVYGMYSCEELPGRIIALSTTGDVCVVDAETLDVKSSFAGSSTVTDAHTFSAKTAAFTGSEHGAILILCLAGTSQTTHLRILAIDEADSISEKDNWELPVEKKAITSISCSSAGILSVLALDGTLSSFTLSAGEPAPLSSPIHLTGFSFISTTSNHPVSLLALTSSHVLLAALASQEVTLLLWDVQFSVLLASHILPIPSSLTASTLHLRLVPGAQSQTKTQDRVLGQTYLVLSSDSAENKTTSVILVVPYSVPSVSTISAAMGKGAAGKKWLRASEEQPNLSEKTKPSVEETTRTNLLATMRTAMQAGRPKAAVAALTKWAPKNESDAVSMLDYNFVKELLSIVLVLPSADSKPTSASVQYAPDAAQYLLEKRVVSSAMVTTPGGLLGALRARGDWRSIELAFRTVMDLSESEIIECLRVVVANHRHSTAPPSNEAMDVDDPAPSTSTASSIVPLLPVFLNLVITYSTSRGPLLFAIRRYMQSPEELTTILQILDGWITRQANVEENLMPTPKDLKKTEQGIWTVVGRKNKDKKQKAIPPLEKISDFIQIILDASFLTLLQHPASHKILRSLNAQLNPELEFAHAAETLRGSLEPFAIAQEKAVKESLIPQQERDREKQKGDWRQRRKGAGAAPGVAADIGVYQLEELVL